MKDPNQLRFDYEQIEVPDVHDGQMSLEYSEEEKAEPIRPTKYPSVEIGKRAIHLADAIQAELDYSRANGFVIKGETDQISLTRLNSRVAARDAYGAKADAEFDQAWGSVEELVEAGFDKNIVMTGKEADKDDFTEHMSVKNRRRDADGSQKAMARRMIKLKKHFDKLKNNNQPF